MADLTRLHQVLVEYESALEAHRKELTDSFKVVKERYGALRDVYDGVAAREFKAGWQCTSDAFDAYTERLASLEPLLRERIEALQAADSGTV